GLVEVNNEEAFRMAKRLNQEESIIAGPSSGMALAGALQLVKDEPGVICVVIFPDNAFKYATSFQKHLPELFPSAGAAASGSVQALLSSMVTLAQTSPDVITVEEAAALKEAGGVFVDVRTQAEFDDE